MERTERYYEADAFRTEAASRILAAEPLAQGGGRIALDGTVFYPEGGGQPADRGSLILLDGTILQVLDVHETAGVIWHTVDALPPAAAVGETVAGRLDWEWRFDKMQQHTGEHILSGTLHRLFGAENVGFHIGAEAVRMDTSVPISAEGLRQAEWEANQIVWQNVPVQIRYPSPAELSALTYRSKKEIEGQVRIVAIPGADVCACCGTHTAASGQVGQIKILTAENYKGGVRLSVVCGGRALREAQAMRARQADIGALLSAKASETARAVHRVYEEYTALRFAHFGLCGQLFDALAAAVQPGEDVIRIVPGLDPDSLHRLAVRLSEATDGLCAALTPNEKGTGYCLAQAGGDVRALTRALNAACNGRGGGKPGICQGSCAADPQTTAAFLQGQRGGCGLF
ncbi:MAG: alanyl-tRNA editing protein [Faecalibacterium sp.]